MVSSNKNNGNREALGWIYRNIKHYIPAIVLISIIAAATSLSFVALALISKNLLDIATGSREGQFLHYVIAIVSIIILQVIFAGVDAILKTYTSSKLNMALRKNFFATVSKRKYSEITQYHSGDILNRFTSDIDVIVTSSVNIIPYIVSMFAKLIGGIASMIALDWRVAIIIFVAGIIVPAIGRIINRKYKSLHKDCQQAEGKTRSFAQECFENMVVVKSFEGEAAFSKKLGQYMNFGHRLKMKRGMLSAVTHLSLYSFFTIGYYAVMVWGANGIAAGAITYGTLMAFLQLVEQLRAPLQNISGIIPQYYSAIASAERLIELEKGERDMAPLEKSKIDLIKSQFSGIEIKNVFFAYKDENILSNCSFTIPSGKITALTGESGSGKSTIFRILLGLFEPESGSITVNGNIPLNSSLRGIFAYVPQGNMVLSGTIRENLTLCNNNIADDELIKATKAAEIYDIISEMPDGFDTVLTERGGGLSEGQIQRISIARALLTDAPILLLDEATSALDEETETKVLDNIKALHGKTVLFVTHRNTSLKVCDRIIHIADKQFSLIKE